ncbi:MAG: dCTP deaminase [bacterium]|nr:dCTP deaminase [bacterium]
MPIGPKTLLKLVKTKKLVENLSDRELTNPEGAGFDLRLGEVYKIKGRGFLGIDERQTPKERLVAKYKAAPKKKRQAFTIKPGEFVLVKTVESVNLPKDIAGHLYARSTLFRSGLFLSLTQVAPGYDGELTMGLTNVGGSIMEIELGARIAHIQFTRVEGGGSLYRGQWKGGRVSARKKEKQV